MTEYQKSTHFQDVEMESPSEQECLQKKMSQPQYIGPSTSGFSSLDILDLEAASKSHINDVNEKDIEEETQNIMDEIEDKHHKESKNMDQGIILQIVYDKGNLKSKQITKYNKSNSTNKNEDDSENMSEQAAHTCLECASCFDGRDELLKQTCNCGNNGLFLCEMCKQRCGKLDGLLQHIKMEHRDIEIPREYETLLNKQLLAIEKVKITARELMNLHKFSAVEILLDTSKKKLESFKMDIFGKGDVNVFKMYIAAVYRDIYNDINVHKIKKSVDKVVKKCKRNNVKTEKENLNVGPKKPGNKRIKKDSTKKSAKKIKKSFINIEFSSEDELCLKDSILKSQEAKVLDDGEIVGRLNEDCGEICLQFYAVPCNTTGKSISLYEMEQLRVATRNIWSGKQVNLSAFKDIMIRRYEREIDEVLPENALFAGYVSKENKSVFKVTKKFSDIFDANCQLNDGVKEHSKTNKSIRTTVKYNEESSTHHDQNSSDAALVEMDMKDKKIDLVTGTGGAFSESDDSYDDGFDQATKFLVELPVTKRRKKMSALFSKCDICNQKFNNNKELVDHTNSSHIELWRCYTCKVCGIKLVPRVRLWKHFKLHTNKVIHECEVCCESFISSEDKDEHIDKEHCKEPFVCPLCKSQFEYLHLLRQHFTNEHNVNSHLSGIDLPTSSRPSCTKCHRTFTSLGRLSQHMATKHQNKNSKKGKK